MAQTPSQVTMVDDADDAAPPISLLADPVHKTQEPQDLEKAAAVEEETTKAEVSPRDDPFCVDWEEGELANPKAWSRPWRWYLTSLAGMVCFAATFPASLPSSTATQMKAELGCSTLQVTLATSNFVLGYAIGPSIWAPMSEVFGRRVVYLGTYVVYMAFIVPCAVARNIETILICRLIGGTFAACSLTNTVGSIGDLWPPVERGRPFAQFSITPVLGPLLSPIASGFLAERYGFRAPYWMLLAFSGVLFIPMVFAMPETYSPFLLKQKARRLRKETGDSRYWAPLEREDHRLKAIVSKVLARPLIVLFTEPIVLLFATYMSYTYAILYLSFALYPAIFRDLYGMSAGVGSLPFLAMAAGSVAAFLTAGYWDRQYEIAFKANGNQPVPEARLRQMWFGSPILVIGLFWLGWGSKGHWIVPTLAGLPLGYAIFCLFQGSQTYLGDCYQYYAASAFGGAQIMRACFGFGFPLFASSMVKTLGIPWTGTLLGFLALLMSPVPFAFARWGPAVRKRSKYAF